MTTMDGLPYPPYFAYFRSLTMRILPCMALKRLLSYHIIRILSQSYRDLNSLPHHVPSKLLKNFLILSPTRLRQGVPGYLGEKTGTFQGHFGNLSKVFCLSSTRSLPPSPYALVFLAWGEYGTQSTSTQRFLPQNGAGNLKSTHG